MIHKVKIASKFIIDKIGNKSWYNKQGKLHRTNGPAIKHYDNSESWMQNGRYHRLDGAAVVGSNGEYYSYYIDNIPITEDDYWDHPLVKEFAKQKNNVT